MCFAFFFNRERRQRRPWNRCVVVFAWLYFISRCCEKKIVSCVVNSVICEPSSSAWPEAHRWTILSWFGYTTICTIVADYGVTRFLAGVLCASCGGAWLLLLLYLRRALATHRCMLLAGQQKAKPAGDSVVPRPRFVDLCGNCPPSAAFFYARF